ncbi:Clavaminate synthase-like protein [Bimuria novae-zelandiae CBS 107.79]|uniref:Clavaminate synthase-like protein n=1 Tax=Bimuria novae-zelandiae CBS 107.79 TaxID=1447943 RepID=A0A6A5URU5_9PLEO|nr:Clavaminate synthase-like protein [Bimuria novae-zelandiae CBS 107.79]
MPTSKYFDQYPSFPSIPSIPVADIPKISLALYDACRQHGFMLLDLTGSTAGDALLKDSECMFDLLNATLTLKQDILEKYHCDHPQDLTGYKREGFMKTEDGKPDAVGVYTLGQDDILGTVTPRAHPEPIESHRVEFRKFITRAHLLSPVQLANDDHRINFVGHTDIGIITLLFNVVGGLQVLPSGVEIVDANWSYVRPQEGCSVINIGDILTEWTGGLLRSSLHRVVSPLGDQAQFPRRRVAYLVRAEKGAIVQRLRDSRVISPLKEGEEEDKRTLDAKAAWRAHQIMNGNLKLQAKGG